MDIDFICTGGTIDKDYAPSAGTYNFEIAEPAIKRVIERTNPNFKYYFNSILKKDSLDLTDEDRETIYAACKNSKSKKIVISHGTDTMVKTAEKLSSIEDKVIILFGSAKPERFYDTDAYFNAGIAIGAVNVLNKGVYVAMQGRIYEWNKCKKQSDGKFVET